MCFPKQWHCKLHEVKIDKTERRTKHTHNYSWRYQLPSLNNKESSYIENQQGHVRTKPHHQSTGSSQNLQNTPPNDSKTHIFSSTHEPYTETDHILGHKTNLDKCKRTEIIQSVFSDYNRIKPESKQKDKITGQSPNT